MGRDEILKRAETCVCGGRDQEYGKPEDSFDLISILWSAYTKTTISSKDVAIMMALLKIARAKNSDSIDNFVDLAGYAACAGELSGCGEQKQKINCELY